MSSATVWTLWECHIVVVWRATSSTGVVQPLWNTDHRGCCMNVEQHTSLCRSSGVGACWRQRWADSCLPDTSVHCRIDTGRPGQRSWIGLVVAQATSAVVAESAWCDQCAAHQLQVAHARCDQVPVPIVQYHSTVHTHQSHDSLVRLAAYTYQTKKYSQAIFVKICAVEDKPFFLVGVTPAVYARCVKTLIETRSMLSESILETISNEIVKH